MHSIARQKTQQKFWKQVESKIKRKLQFRALVCGKSRDHRARAVQQDVIERPV